MGTRLNAPRVVLTWAGPVCGCDHMLSLLRCTSQDLARTHRSRRCSDFVSFPEDFCRGLPSEYHVADSWESYDKLKPVLDNRLSAWRSSRE